MQDLYANGFMEFKPDKKLHWLPQLGTITLELELQDRTVEVEVTPLEAAVIGLFEEKGAFPPLRMISMGSRVFRRKMDSRCLDVKRRGSCRGVCDGESVE